ncbi:hypothetical protein V6N12_075013 [Hibiscus sabdariffa]|uniref:RNase H type-1 domain-containing protein n=1 Tax=Hibiscus sabdariffa TaxID=183260 RepID=A0ABR2BZ80_9ROSI
MPHSIQTCYPPVHVLFSGTMRPNICYFATSLGDSLTIIKKLQSGSNDMFLIGMILSDVNSLSKFLEGVTFNIVNRACNEVAHKTALLGRNSTSISVWVEEAPTVIEAAAQKDRRWVDPPN